MEIASMKSKITIQQSMVTSDSIGNRTNTWTDFYSCFACANLKSAKEYASAGQTISSDSLTFTVRWCEKLKNISADKFRIVFNGEIYNITCIDDYFFEHKTLKLSAERVKR